ncbi:hypothetical protein MPTK1_8g18210 [Marchantia polymorpha subsp. ruderalis]|uniref:NAD(P)-binding domain-containing protein n=1 Tax=Marchantia polymorpha TaxID=3197 RepID=A0A2R6X8L4_MARPO|nr:hypothetical protein MARPO_0030s0153 [Marchantia polymorpha]BBN20321.1 hypothetical protein Mp_8g18210 [Marchantia polymorpha subsp. ruderalis]|eukprot:PTQ42442.1 hypothetical protein MARPO_0030s0153 [Marchantia polymorpha]
MAAQGAAGAVQTISSQPRPRTSGTAPPSHPTSCHAIVARRWARKDGIGFSASNKPLVVNAEKKKSGGGGGFSFGDQLLDYIEGGPKLRKWYGAPEQMPRSESQDEEEDEAEEEEEPEEDTVRDVVLVTDADSETVLELILKRLRVRALVKDIKSATVGFGAYVEPVEGDVNDRAILKSSLRGVRAIICPTKVGGLADRELVKGVEHIVLLSKLTVNRNQAGLGSLFGALGRRDAEENEAAISSLGVPYTIVRAGALKDEPGGQLGFSYGQGGSVQGTISRQDAAYVCAEALDAPPENALVFEVVNGAEDVEDWSAVLTSMKESRAAPS